MSLLIPISVISSDVFILYVLKEKSVFAHDNFVLGRVRHIANIRLYCILTPVLTASVIGLDVSLVSYITTLLFVRVKYLFSTVVVVIMEQSICLHVFMGDAPRLVISSVVAHSHWLLTRNLCYHVV